MWNDIPRPKAPWISVTEEDLNAAVAVAEKAEAAVRAAKAEPVDFVYNIFDPPGTFATKHKARMSAIHDLENVATKARWDIGDIKDHLKQMHVPTEVEPTPEAIAAVPVDKVIWGSWSDTGAMGMAGHVWVYYLTDNGVSVIRTHVRVNEAAYDALTPMLWENPRVTRLDRCYGNFAFISRTLALLPDPDRDVLTAVINGVNYRFEAPYGVKMLAPRLEQFYNSGPPAPPNDPVMKIINSGSYYKTSKMLKRLGI
ncbi:MAG: hypothetical protein LBH13_00885 [Cellulomonadaceae bacterium]|jgi:hypothetical protein|nr:hypothetical protein [Cellulomonadaceae bacterium]